MPTALDMITFACQSIGVYAPGEPLSNADATFCLVAMNDMLDSWSNESLTVYSQQTQTFTLQPGVTVYTIGPGGTWAGSRPLMIRDDPGTCFITDNTSNNYPVDVISQQQFNLISNRVYDSNIPNTIFYDPQFPLGIINVYPQPDIGYTLTFMATLALADFGSLTAQLTLPPGYKEAIQRNLAIQIWPHFKPDGSNPSQTMMALAAKAKGNVKRTNFKPLKSFFDPEIVSRGSPMYNIYSDAGR